MLVLMWSHAHQLQVMQALAQPFDSFLCHIVSDNGSAMNDHLSHTLQHCELVKVC